MATKRLFPLNQEENLLAQWAIRPGFFPAQIGNGTNLHKGANKYLPVDEILSSRHPSTKLCINIVTRFSNVHYHLWWEEHYFSLVSTCLIFVESNWATSDNIYIEVSFTVQNLCLP